MTRLGMASGWLLKRARMGQVWCALLSLSLGLSAASAIEGSWNSSREQPPQLEDRALDPTLAEAPQAAADPVPSGIFYLSLGSTFIVFFLLLSLFNGRVVRGLLGEAMEKEKSGILLLSQFSLALYALHQVAGDAVPESLRSILHLICALLILSMGGKYLVAVNMSSDRKWSLLWSVLNDDPLMLAALFMPAVLFSIAGLARGLLNPLAGRSTLLIFAFYLLVLVALLAGYLQIARRLLWTERRGAALALFDLNTAVILAGAPLILIPLGLLIANEIQFAIPAADPQAVGLVVVAVLIAASVTLFILRRRGLTKLGGVAILTGFYFPALVATLASFRTHLWTQNLGTLDYFRAGQQVLPSQQWWEFGSVPFLDLVPSQGLADAGFSSLFVVFNGVEGLDSLVWLPWIPVVVGYLVIYAFLAVVASPLLALLVTTLLPTSAVIVGQYALALLPAVLLVATLRRPSFRRFLFLWLTALSLLLWRPRLGWPAALALLVMVGLVALFENRKVLVPAAGSLALVLGLVPAGLLITEIAWGGDTLIALTDFSSLLSDGGVGQFGALEIDSGSMGVVSVLQRLLPVLAVVCVLYFCLRQFVRQEPFTASGYALLYLVAFSLKVPARAGVHDGQELFDPSFLLLILALLPFMVFQRAFRPRHVGRSTWLLAVMAGCALLGSVDIYHLVGGGVAHGKLRTFKAGEPRVLFNPRPHEALVEFLQQELDAEESFLDFTGSTALYSLAAKRFPWRAISDLRSTSESLQRAQIASIEDRRVAGELPLVVFRSPPRLERSRVFPPTEVLSYRVAEYIYGHYLPFARIAGWELWRERGDIRGKPAPPAKAISSSSIRQNFPLGDLPARWATEDPWQSVSKTEILAAGLEQPVVVRPGISMPLEWAAESDLSAATYLHVRARPLWGRQPVLTVSYGPEPRSSFEFRLVPRPPSHRDGGQTIALELKEDPKEHMLHLVSRCKDRFVFRSTGRDPWLRKFVDLSSVPVVEAGTEQWIAIRYRAEKPGEGQIFFATRTGAFREKASVTFPVTVTQGDPSTRWVTVPVLGVKNGERLADMRLDPPVDGEFEIVGVKLIRRPNRPDDYLIRLTTQYQWATGGVQPMILSSESQILIDNAFLRSGD